MSSAVYKSYCGGGHSMVRCILRLLACISMLPLASCGKQNFGTMSSATEVEAKAAVMLGSDYVPITLGQRRVAIVEVIAADGNKTRGRIVREVVGTEEIGAACT